MSLGVMSLIVVALLSTVFISAGILFAINTFFKIPHTTFARSAAVVCLMTIAEVVFSLPSVVFPSTILNIASLVAAGIADFYIYKKIFHTNLKQFLMSFITLNVVGIVFLIGALFVRSYWLEPILYVGTGMSPVVQPGDYVFFEKWNTLARKGDVVLVQLPCSGALATTRNCPAIMRIVGAAGDQMQGNVVSEDEYLVAKDSNPDQSAIVKRSLVIGKLFFNVGQTGLK